MKKYIGGAQEDMNIGTSVPLDLGCTYLAMEPFNFTTLQVPLAEGFLWSSTVASIID